MKKITFEEDLHDFFYQNPYLLVDNNESIIDVIHEYRLDSNSTVDIYIETITKKFYCEIKLGKIKESHLYQAVRYYNTIQQKNNGSKIKKFVVLLIGHQISKELCEKASKYLINVKIIGKDVPKSIKICKKCRKCYNSLSKKCIFCNSNKVLEIINLDFP